MLRSGKQENLELSGFKCIMANGWLRLCYMVNCDSSDVDVIEIPERLRRIANDMRSRRMNEKH